MGKLTKEQEKAFENKEKFRWQPMALYVYGKEWKELAFPGTEELTAKSIATAALTCDEHPAKCAGVLDRTDSIIRNVDIYGKYC